MNITFTGLAIIASLSNTLTTPTTTTSILPLQTELFSKNELVQIINDEQQTNIVLDKTLVIVPNISIDSTVLIAKTNNASSSDSISNKVAKASADE